MERRRSPLSQRPRARVIFVLVPVSSMTTSLCGSVRILGCRSAFHASRAWRTSDRSHSARLKAYGMARPSRPAPEGSPGFRRKKRAMANVLETISVLGVDLGKNVLQRGRSGRLRRSSAPASGEARDPAHAGGKASALRRGDGGLLRRPSGSELCGKVGDGVNQAADLISATASIPSLNFIPLTTFGNCYLRGISAGDFQEALAALLGKDAPNLCAAVIGLLKSEWEDGFDLAVSARSWTPGSPV